MTHPTISLCVIAKDEEGFLPGCLASVDGAVDERVVLDTGSTDRTVALAQAAGARVVHRAWSGDFSAARNAVLAAATGDWVLVLDADERLGPGAAEVIRAAVATGGFDCGLLPLHNASRLDAAPADVIDGTARRGEPVLLPRLLRVDAALAWAGVVHESVGHWLADGRTSQMVPAPIVHLGDLPAVRAAKDKDQRNRALLEAACAAHPDDPVPRTYLARERLRAGDGAGARADITRAWAAMLDAWGRPGPKPPAATTANIHAFLLLTDGRIDPALAVLDQADPLAPGHPNLALLRAAALDLKPDASPVQLAGAAAALDAVRRDSGRAWTTELNPGATSWAAATVSGQLRLTLGEHARAARDFRDALRASPDHLAARLGLAEARVGMGEGAAVLGHIEPLLKTGGADPWAVAALAAGSLGDRATARALAGRVRGQRWQSSARARRLAALLKRL